MQLSKYTDYSLRVLMYLALAPAGKKVQIRQICDAYGASHNHMVKVVGNLARLGYIRTVRGKSGGLFLDRPPPEINVGKVIRQTEYNFQAVDCHQPECPLTSHCILPGIFHQACEAYLRVLEKFTLRDLVADSQGMAAALGVLPGTDQSASIPG